MLLDKIEVDQLFDKNVNGNSREINMRISTTILRFRLFVLVILKTEFLHPFF